MTDRTIPVTGHPVPASINGYAHPYAAPPQPPNLPPYFNIAGPPPYPNQQRATFLRRVIVGIVASFIIIGTVVFIMSLVLRPQIPQFRVETLTLTNFNVTSNSMISGNWNAGITIRNPNSKITLYYDHLQAALFYRSRSIAMTNVAPFVQGKKSDTLIRASFASLPEYFDDLIGINNERARGAVEFNLRISALVRFKAGGWWTRRRFLRIYCPSLLVNVSTSSTAGTLTSGSKHCRVGL